MSPNMKILALLILSVCVSKCERRGDSLESGEMDVSGKSGKHSDREWMNSDFIVIGNEEEIWFYKNGTFVKETSKVQGNRRGKRNTVLLPGTNWCGKGNNGKGSGYGPFDAVDRCCRYHDKSCPFWIQSMTKKYGLFNNISYSLQHCNCDRKFRNCLKTVNTDISNLVGVLFFDVLKTKCFVFEDKELCTDRNWLGKCLKTEYVKQASIRDNLGYLN